MSLEKVEILVSYEMTIDSRCSRLAEADGVPHEVLAIIDPHERAVAYVQWFASLYGSSYITSIANRKNVEEIK